MRGRRETTYHGREPCLTAGCTAVSNEQRSGLVALAHKTGQFIQRGAAPTCTGRRWRGTESGARRIVQHKREILQHTPAQVNRGATQRVQHHHTTRTSSIHRFPVPRAVAVSGVGEGAGEPLPVLARGSDPEPASTPNGGDMPMSRSVSPSAWEVGASSLSAGAATAVPDSKLAPATGALRGPCRSSSAEPGIRARYKRSSVVGLAPPAI